jgi:hypothetical protein
VSFFPPDIITPHLCITYPSTVLFSSFLNTSEHIIPGNPQFASYH